MEERNFRRVRMPVTAVAEDVLRRYRRDGFAVAAGLLDRATVEAARADLAGLADQGSGALIAPPLHLDPFLLGLTTHPALVALAAAALECRPQGITPFGCTYIVKAARTGPPALWHQDGHQWRLDRGITSAVTAWIALDDTSARNGGLTFLPGSHHLPTEPLLANHDRPSIFGCELDPEVVAAAAARGAPHTPRLRAGDVSIHHPHVIHGSSPNASSAPRRALAVRYRRD